MNRSDQLFVEDFGELHAMLIWQDALTGYLFENSTAPVERGSAAHIQETLACLAVEAAEALAPWLTSTKPWKDRYPDMDHTDEEMIDVLHYLLTYFNLRNMGAQQITEAYRTKNLHNFGRLTAKLAALKEKTA